MNSFVDILNREIEKKALTRKLGTSPVRPSAAGTCPTQLAYKVMEWKGRADYGIPSMSANTLLLLEHGSVIEKELIRHFEENGFEVLFRQQPLTFDKLVCESYPEFSQIVAGAPDFVLKYGDLVILADSKSVGGTKWTWDAKTKKFKSMQSVETVSDTTFYINNLEAFIHEVDDPFLTNNLAQLNYYAHSKFMRDYGIEYGSLIQYAKVDSRLREIRFKTSESLFQKCNQKFLEALEAAARGKPESAPRHSKENVACRYCRYSHVCPTMNPANNGGN